MNINSIILDGEKRKLQEEKLNLNLKYGKFSITHSNMKSLNKHKAIKIIHSLKECKEKLKIMLEE